MKEKEKIKELFKIQYSLYKDDFDNKELLIAKIFKNNQTIFKNTSKNTLIDDLYNLSIMDGIKENLVELDIVTEKESKKILSFKIK